MGPDLWQDREPPVLLEGQRDIQYLTSLSLCYFRSLLARLQPCREDWIALINLRNRYRKSRPVMPSWEITPGPMWYHTCQRREFLSVLPPKMRRAICAGSKSWPRLIKLPISRQGRNQPSKGKFFPHQVMTAELIQIIWSKDCHRSRRR